VSSARSTPQLEPATMIGPAVLPLMNANAASRCVLAGVGPLRYESHAVRGDDLSALLSKDGAVPRESENGKERHAHD
jgi:hypothetical protein